MKCCKRSLHALDLLYERKQLLVQTMFTALSFCISNSRGGGGSSLPVALDD
jgi:hypothetical protein